MAVGDETAIREAMRSISASVTAAKRKIKPSNLGELTDGGNPTSKQFSVGGSLAIGEIKKGITQLKGLGVSHGKGQERTEGRHSQLADTPGNFLHSLKKQLPKLEDNQNTVLQFTGAQRASQREAIQANAAILSGRKSRRSGVQIPRLPRGAGLLLPFDTQRLS